VPTFYHVDMLGRLAPGMTIDLSPEAPSLFGRIYLQQFKAAGVVEALEKGEESPKKLMLLRDCAYREYYLELFRRHNPRLKDLPIVSRLSAFFAVKSIEDAHRYIERFGFKGHPAIYSVDCDGEPPCLDMTWLDQQFPKRADAFMYYYESYWKGALIGQDPHLSSHEKRGSLIEVLITSKVTIGALMNHYASPSEV